MLYTVYKITNKINDKEYIGKHQTDNLSDGYMGSGKYLKRAIAKHGIDNFVKEILYIFDSEIEMNAKETELVTEDFCKLKNNYNLCVGGKGGFGYINSTYDPLTEREKQRRIKIRSTHLQKGIRPPKNTGWSDEDRLRISLTLKQKHRSGVLTPSMLGKKHSIEVKTKMSMLKSGTGKGKDNNNSKTVFIDGILYDSYRAAALAVNVNSDTITRRVRNGIYQEKSPLT